MLSFSVIPERPRPVTPDEFDPRPFANISTFPSGTRVAILDTITRMGQGARNDLGTGAEVSQVAARQVGFGSERTARNAQTVVRSGVPELVEAMDKGDIAIRPAAEIARLPADEQRKIVALPRVGRTTTEAEKPQRRRSPAHKPPRKITIPWSAIPAARLLA